MTASGIISGAGNLFKIRSGSTLTLTGANSYTGTTTITDGTLAINSIGTTGTNTSIGNASSTISIGASATLQYIGTGHTSSRVINLSSGAGTIDASGSGALT